MKLVKIIEKLKEQGLLVSYEGNLDIEIENVCYDSRKIDKNCIFVVKGLNFKKEYLTSSINEGVLAYISKEDLNIDIPKVIVKDELKAMAIASELVYDDKNSKLTLLGITGTKGKTTAVSFLHNILDYEAKQKTGFWTTIDHFTGKTYGASHNTTPEIVDLYKIIRDCKNENIPYLTFEVSSQAKKLDRIYGLNFDIGGITNISYDHVSPLEHKDFEEYFNCKLGFLKQCKKVFLYKNIEMYDRFAYELKDKEIYTFGDDSSCDFYYSNIRKDETGTIFSVIDNINNVTRDYKITIAGEFNCINACLVIGICSILNISYESILKGLLKTKVIGRMSIYKGKCTLIVDYAHNKISVDALMKALKKDYPNSKIRLVFGCPGDRGVNRRKDVGILAGMYADYIYLTAEDPQTKKISDICDEIISYIKPFNKPYEVIEDRELAIKKAYDDASNDDVIAVIGKGDETYQIVNGEYVYYKSDVKVAEELTKNTVNV